MKISQILQEYTTDKHSKEGHHYGHAYEYLFRPYRGKIDLLEVGVYLGDSLLAWKVAFPEATIVGVDNQDLVEKKHPDISYVICDIEDFKSGKKYDIVIDDGSHRLKDVLHTIDNCKLKPGGIMVIEDCQRPEAWLEKIEKHTDYSIEGVDLRHINGRMDDYLIVLRNYE